MVLACKLSYDGSEYLMTGWEGGLDGLNEAGARLEELYQTVIKKH